MKLSNDLVKDLQKARVYRAVAVLLEIAAIYAIIWGISVVVQGVLSWI